MLAAVVVTRLMQNCLPARPRPLYDPALDAVGFVPPYEVPPGVLRDWSSFPSDTAGLAFAVATAAFLAHRGAGACAWSLVVICLPRVHAGFHYPSDVLGGAAVGIGVMAAAARLPVPPRVGAAMARLERTRRGWLYAGLFLLTYQMATVFADARNLAGFAAHAPSAAWHRL